MRDRGPKYKFWLMLWLNCLLGGATLAYPTNNITLTFNCAATNLGPAIPDNFIGMALARSYISGYGSSAQVFNPNWNPGAANNTWEQFTNLIGQIGVHHWRVQNITYEGYYPDPTFAQDNQFFATLKDAGVTNVIYSLTSYCEVNSTDNIATATNILMNPTDASMLESFAFGGEPNFNIYQECPSNPPWTEPEYEAQWNMVYTQTEAGIAAAGLPEPPIAGPDDGGGIPPDPGLDTPQMWLPQFAIDEVSKPLYVMATQHDYDSSCGPTWPDALGMATTNLSLDRVTGWNEMYTECLAGAPNWPNDWYGNKLRYRMSEGVAYNDGGGGGVSDGNTNGQNFSTALWELDFCHWWAQRGCSGVNPQNRPVDYNAPMQLNYTTGNWTPMPYAYGMKAFNLGGHGFPFTNTAAVFSNPDSINTTAYGVLSHDGNHLYVTVINKTFNSVGAHAANVTIPAPGNFSLTNAQYLLLSSEPAGEDGDATILQTAYLGGAIIPNSGSWNGTWTPLTLGNQGEVNLIVQPATAVVIDLQGNNAPAISAEQSENNLIITYNGTLLSSTGVNGPYTPVGGAASPYIVPVTNTQEFYRTESLTSP
jgi:hypothetical protein